MQRATYQDRQPRLIDLPDFGRRRITRGQTLEPLTDADVAALKAEGWDFEFSDVAIKAAKPKRVRTRKPLARAEDPDGSIEIEG